MNISFLNSPLKKNFASGFIGACALNLTHEFFRTRLKNAPHVDVIAMRGIERSLEPLGIDLPQSQLRRVAFIGDVVSNSFYYSMIGKFSRKNGVDTWPWALTLGLAAGLGAVFLPPKMGLGQQPSSNMKVTGTLTVLWYVLGALATAKVVRRLASIKNEDL